MGTLDLTIQVLDLSPKATLTDIHRFFSYCGTIDKIQLWSENQSQSALVTFKKPYAVQTALLLTDAIIVDHPIRVLPVQGLALATPRLEKMNNETKDNSKEGLVPVAQSVMQSMTLNGHATLNRAKQEIEEKYKLAISTAEKMTGHVGAMIVNSQCVSSGALWLSDVLDKAAKCTAELGNYSKRNPNSGKEK